MPARPKKATMCWPSTVQVGVAKLFIPCVFPGESQGIAFSQRSRPGARVEGQHEPGATPLVGGGGEEDGLFPIDGRRVALAL